ATVATRLGVKNLEIIAKVDKKKRAPRATDLESAVWETIHRRPCTLADLTAMLGAGEAELLALLETLVAQGRIEITREARGTFYRTIKE
ncbi:MAG: hypothetical protein MI749_12530, partial [Desulfovibrionales bacterium]|nr:hypothetical protein [Desulfovibrionales bacterium]